MSNTPPTPIPDGGLNLTSLLNIVGGATQQMADHRTPGNNEGKQNTFDPFEFELWKHSADTLKCRDIRDFVSLFQEQSINTSKVTVGEIEVSLPESKTKLESITPLQYMEASLRILREMAIKDAAPPESILNYVGYLIKTANMGQRFNWKSMLKYDAEYRKAQATAGFPWGADNAYMMQLFLREDGKPSYGNHGNSSRQDSPANQRSKYDPASGRVICERFNGRNGCSLRFCNYAHLCRTCYSATHGQFNHRSKGEQTGGHHGNQQAPKKD